MRCDAAAALARKAVSAPVVLLLPKDTALAEALVRELGVKGVPPGRITLVLHGRNTREQALDLLRAEPGMVQRQIALVTAPENMYRTLLTKPVAYPPSTMPYLMTFVMRTERSEEGSMCPMYRTASISGITSGTN